MDIFYFSNDEVHLTLAEELARGCDVTILGVHPDQEPPHGHPFDAALYDVDAVVPGRRLEILTRILLGARERPAAVHGYAITDKQAAALHRGKIFVSQHLSAALLTALCSMARQKYSTISSDHAPTDLTSISLDP